MQQPKTGERKQPNEFLAFFRRATIFAFFFPLEGGTEQRSNREATEKTEKQWSKGNKVQRLVFIFRGHKKGENISHPQFYQLKFHSQSKIEKNESGTKAME